MMRVIFVPVANRPECAAALNTAFSIGRSVGASVIGCHIRPHSNSRVTLPSRLGMSGFSNDDAEWQAAFKPRDARKGGTAAKTLFARLADSHGYDLIRQPRIKPGAVWMEKIGSPNKVIGIMGPLADLIVVSRPTAKGGTLARLFLSASLLRSSRPVLVLPQFRKRAVGNRVCIAWNQSVEAAQAVAAAMPFLTRTDHVSIVSCGHEAQAGPKSSQLASYLKYWGVKSQHISLPGKNEPGEILAAYKSTGSDLLVMGAYSRSRMSQLVFGSVTEYMLNRASIPVLMLYT